MLKEKIYDKVYIPPSWCEIMREKVADKMRSNVPADVEIKLYARLNKAWENTMWAWTDLNYFLKKNERVGISDFNI